MRVSLQRMSNGRNALSAFRNSVALEAYERQAAHFTFDDMDDELGTGFGRPGRGFAGFSLWRHEFVESRWLSIAVRPDWLWIRAAPVALVVVADFPNAPAA